jgi:large subunit ribosomal protein L22
MITRAETRYARLTPRKFRQIIPLVMGKNPEDAMLILMTVKKKASIYAIELLKSAVANAKRMQGVDIANLCISKMIANCGPQLKRFRAGSMGRAGQIRKRTSHIIVELDEIAHKALKNSKEAVKSEAKPKAAGGVKEKHKEGQTKKKAAAVKKPAAHNEG